VFPGYFINHRQPEISDKTGNTYIAEATTLITDSVEIPTTNLGFTTAESSKNVSESDCDTATDNRK